MNGLSSDDQRRIADYVAGEYPPDAAEQVREWIHADPARQAVASSLQAAQGLLRQHRREHVDMPALSAALSARIQAAETASSQARRGRMPTVPAQRRWWMTGVISGVAACFAGFLIWTSRSTVDNQNPAPHGSRYVTQSGQSATVTLADGSRVTLAPNTTLQVDGAFGERERAITITGEAYVQVINTPSAPFLVHAAHTTTRVLGTAFTVRAYRGEHVRVAVETGKVTVSSAVGLRPSMTLIAGTVGEVTDSTATPLRERIDQYTAWTNGRLVFHDTPLTDVLAAFKRWYGYDLQLADSTLATEHVTMGVSTQSSAEAFATLKRLLNVDLVFADSTVTLRTKRHNPAVRYERRDSSLIPSYGAGR